MLITAANLSEALAIGPYTWPGGYPLVWIMSDGEPLCCACASAHSAELADALQLPGVRSDWLPVALEPHYEGPPEVCAHCGALVESAYGDPDADPDTES